MTTTTVQTIGENATIKAHGRDYVTATDSRAETILPYAKAQEIGRSAGLVDRNSEIELILTILGISHESRTTDEYGSYTETWTLPPGTSHERIGELVNLRGTLCQHPYDCGRMYAYPAEIVRHDGAHVIVTQSHYVNC